MMRTAPSADVAFAVDSSGSPLKLQHKEKYIQANRKHGARTLPAWLMKLELLKS